MCKISKVAMTAIVENMGVMASTDVKATFTMFAKKVEDKYVCAVRLTDKSEQLDIQFYVDGDGEEKKASKFSVESKKFVDVAVSLLSFDKDLELSVSDGALSLAVEGVSTLQIPTTTSIDPISFNKEGAIAMTVEGKAFTTLVRKGGFAVDKNSSRPQCKAATLNVVFAEKKLTMSSSDGNIIALANGNAQAIQVSSEADSLKAAIPESALEKLLKIAQGAQAVNMMITETQCVAAAGGSMYTFTLAQQSMDVSKFIEQWEALKLDQGVTADAEQILNGIKVLQTADPDCKGYKLSIDEEDKLEIVTAKGDQSVRLATTEVGESFSGDLGISKSYLEKIVRNLNKGNVTIRTSGASQIPFVITNGTVKEPDSNAVAYVMKLNLAQTVKKTEEKTEETA